MSQYQHTSAILDRASVSDQIAEKYNSFAAGPDTELTAGSKKEAPQMVIARIPDSERSRLYDTSSVSSVSITRAMLLCQKQRLLWRIRVQDIDLSDKGAPAPIFETFDVSGHTFRTDASRSGVTNGSQIATFFRDFEAFRRIIMNICVDKL